MPVARNVWQPIGAVMPAALARARASRNRSVSIGAADRQRRRIDQPELRQHRGLVPVDVLVSELAVAEMNDDNQRDFDPLSGGRDPRSIQSISTVWVKRTTISS